MMDGLRRARYLVKIGVNWNTTQYGSNCTVTVSVCRDAVFRKDGYYVFAAATLCCYYLVSTALACSGPGHMLRADNARCVRMCAGRMVAEYEPCPGLWRPCCATKQRIQDIAACQGADYGCCNICSCVLGCGMVAECHVPRVAVYC